MRTIFAGLFCIVTLAACEAPAAAHDCQCRSGGKTYEQGDVACLDLPQGRQLARCSMVLNNSSWQKLQDGCPVSENVAPATRLDRLWRTFAPHPQGAMSLPENGIPEMADPVRL